MSNPRYQTLMGLGPSKIIHWEHWSDPDAATYLSGIDFYDRPQSCMTRINELYPFVGLHVPKSDEPLPRLEEQEDKGKGRWGHAYRDQWTMEVAEQRFASREEMLSFSPLEKVEKGDFAKWGIGEDYRDEAEIYRRFRAELPAEWGDRAPEGATEMPGFYNTMFMWPLLVFGYQSFLSICLEPEFDRIMREFAEINRRIYRALARLPVHFIYSHDDIVLSSGPVCSPAWMHRHIFPRYEELWGILRAAGKRVVFVADGRLDAFVEDVIACGAQGIVTEPHTDIRAIARKHPRLYVAGEGDNRVLLRNDPGQIRAMVERMTETGRMSGGYGMCIGNHIPFNVPGEAVKRYFDLSAEIAYR